MSGIFPDDRSGIVVILGGMILLVLLGVGLTVMTDATQEEQKADLSDGQAEISELKLELKGIEEEQTKNKERIAGHAEFVRKEKELQAAETRLADLQVRKREVEETLVKIDKEFSAYREDYRKMVWRKAVGRKFPEFVTRGGKTYREVTIKAVTAREVKLGHIAGTASVGVSDLPPALREELHLSVIEAADILAAERKKEEERIAQLREERERKAREEEERRKKARKGGKDPEAQQQLVELKAEYATVRSKLLSVRSDWLEARRKSGGRQKSPPGSLETWAQRAARLSGVQQKGRAKLQELKVRIRALDPKWKPPGEGDNDPFR